MRIVFMGTPEFAVPVLDALVQAGHTVVAVVSQPDREKDKKGNLLQTPVKQYAEAHGLLCLQYDKVSQHADELRAFAPDVMITAAYGQLLSEDVLQAASGGVLNVHASLLPAYRGASPVQSAVLCGETVTGVTVMKTDIGMDTGDMLAVERVAVLPEDTTQTLSEKLSQTGAALLVRILPDYAAGKITPIPQDDALATYCKKVTKADGNIDWTDSAHEVFCKVRAYNPWPSAYTYLQGEMLKIHAAEEVPETEGEVHTLRAAEPGQVCVRENRLYIRCKNGWLKPRIVQLAGKKPLYIDEFLRGKRIDGCVLKNA